MDVSPNLTVDAGLQIATRQPHRCSTLLAESIYPILEGESWFTKEWRLRFCAYLLENIVDRTTEFEVDISVLNRIKQLQMSKAIKLIGMGPPEASLKALVALICMELRVNQKLDMDQQFAFYNVLFKKLFRDPVQERRPPTHTRGPKLTPQQMDATSWL